MNKQLDKIANFLGYTPKVKALEQSGRPLLRASFLKGQPIQPEPKLSDYLGAYRGWTYAAVTAINKEISNIDLKLFKRKSQEEFEMVDSHPVLDLLYNVNPIYTSYHLWEATSGHMELTGESYWWLIGGKKNPKEIWILRPDWMDIKDTKNKIIESYSYGAHGDTKITIPFEEVIPFKDFSPKNPYRGFGTVRAAASAIDTDDYASAYNRSFFTNSARPGGVLETDNNLDDDSFERIREEWEKVHRGTDNTWKVAILEAGLKWKDVGLSQKDMDYLEGRKFTRDEILAMFGVPKPIVAVTDDVNRASAREARSIFLENTIEPKLRKYAATLTEFLLPKYSDGEDLFFDIVSPVPDDKELTLKQIDTNAKHGLMTINELRELQGLEQIEDGDVLVAPSRGGVNTESDTSNEDDDSDDEERSVKPELKTVSKKSKKEKVSFNVRVKPHPHQKTVLDRGLESMTEKAQKMLYAMLKSKKQKNGKDNSDDEKAEQKEHFREMAWRAVIQRTDSREAKMIHKLIELFDGQEARVLNKFDQDFNLSLKAKKQKANISNISDVTGDDDVFASPLMKLIEDFIEAEGILRIQEVTSSGVFFLQSKEVQKYLLKEGAKFVSQVNETTTDKIAAALSDGVVMGESIPQLKDRVRQVFNEARDSRAERIARTEVNKSTNFAAQEAYRQSGVVETKEWLATRDSRVRDDHAGADGQEVGVDEAFNVGGEQLEFPGDPNGSAWNVVNCRCTIIPHVKKNDAAKPSKQKKLKKVQSNATIKDK
jgi:HK97 family phage portal protein